MEDQNTSEYRLRWNNHHSTLVKVLDMLLQQESLVDVTLAAEGKFIRVHKVVLCACSSYFKDLLCQQSDKQTIVFLKDVRFDDLQAVVDYMYRGEVNVSYDQLPLFLSTAKALKIKGLAEQSRMLKPNRTTEQDQETGAHETSADFVSELHEVPIDGDAPAAAPTFVSCQVTEAYQESFSDTEPDNSKDDFNSLDHLEELVPKSEAPELVDTLTEAEEARWSESEVGQVSLTAVERSSELANSIDFSKGNCEITLRRFVCPTCPKSYKNRADMRKHTKHECGKEPRFICPTCGSRFSRSYHLHRHLRQVHCASV